MPLAHNFRFGVPWETQNSGKGQRLFSGRADSPMINSVRNASVSAVILAYPHNIPLQGNGCYGMLCEFNTLPFSGA